MYSKSLPYQRKCTSYTNILNINYLLFYLYKVTLKEKRKDDIHTLKSIALYMKYSQLTLSGHIKITNNFNKITF